MIVGNARNSSDCQPYIERFPADTIDVRREKRKRTFFTHSSSPAQVSRGKTLETTAAGMVRGADSIIFAACRLEHYGRSLRFGPNLRVAMLRGQGATRLRNRFVRRERAVWNSEASGGDGDLGSGDAVPRRYCVTASVDDDLIAAVEGWRRAHGLAEQSEAIGELVRLGLMSEVAKIYRLVCQNGRSGDPVDSAQRKRKRHQRWEPGEHGLPAN